MLQKIKRLWYDCQFRTLLILNLLYARLCIHLDVGDSSNTGLAVTLSLSRASTAFLPDTNIPHGDLQGADFFLNSSRSWTLRQGAAACARGCDALPTCTCWTYVPTGPRCTIKGPGGAGGGPLFPERGPDVSGYKTGHVPSNLTVPNGTQMVVNAGDYDMPGHTSSVGRVINTASLRVSNATSYV